MAERGSARGARRGSAVLSIVAILLVIAALVAGGTYYFVRSLLAPAWVRANVIPILEARYGRRIFFDDFRLRPSSLILDGVRVFEDPGFDVAGLPFLTVEHLVVRFDPLGLLRRTVLIDFVRLDHPKIQLYQDGTGRWNAASLFQPKVDSPPLSGSAARIASRFKRVVTRVELTDATLRIARIPEADKTEPREMVVRDLDSAVMFHPMTGFLDYEARGSVLLAGHGSSAVTAFGVLDLGAPRMELQVAADDLDADALRAFWTDVGTSMPELTIDDVAQGAFDRDILFVAKRLRVEGVDVDALRLELFTSQQAIELRKLEAAAFAGTVNGSAHLDLADSPHTFEATATVEGLDLGALAQAFERKDLANAASGVASGTLAIAGPWTKDEPLRPVVSLDLALDRLDLPALAAALEPKGEPATNTGVARVDPASVTLNVTAAAKTANLGSVTLAAAKLKAKMIKGELDVVELGGRAWQGQITASGRLDLTDAARPWHAQVALDKAHFEEFVPTTPRADWARTTGTVDAELEIAARGLTLAAVRDSLSGRDGSKPEQAYVKGTARADVRALDLDLLGHPPRERDEFGPFELGNVSIDAHVTADRVRLWRLDYENVVADARLEREHIAVERIVGAISQGELELSGDVDLARKGLAYHGQGAFKQVETEPFVSTYLPPDVGYVSGSGSAAFEFSLAGTKKDSALDSLALDGYVALHSGQVRESRVFKHIAKSLGVDEFKELELTRCGGDVHILGRRVSTERLVLGGTDARVLIVGSVGFDSTLETQVWLGFSPGTERNIFSRGILLPYVTDDKGWTYVPFVTTGSVKDPNIKIADEAIRTTAIRAIPDATERIVREGSKLVPGGEAIVGGGIDAVKYILGGLGRVLQANSARAKGEVPLDEPVLPGQTRASVPQHAPMN